MASGCHRFLFLYRGWILSEVYPPSCFLPPQHLLHRQFTDPSAPQYLGLTHIVDASWVARVQARRAHGGIKHDSRITLRFIRATHNNLKTPM